MKRLLTVVLLLAMATTVAMAGWNFDENVFDFMRADSMITYGTNLAGDGYYSNSPHGLVVDANGNFWVAFYFTQGEHFVTASGDTSFYRPLRCISPTGEIVHEITIFDLPDGGKDTLWAGSDHSGTGRGINVDNEGNILYSSYATLYRFDVNTGECTGKFFPPEASLTDACQASDGTYYVGHVGGGKPCWMLYDDFSLNGTAIDTVPTLQRSIQVMDSPDGGFDLFTGPIYSHVHGLERYHSEDPLFESFVIQDTLMQWSYTDNDGNEVVDAPWASSIDVMPNGDFIIGTLGISDASGPYKGYWYVLNPYTDVTFEDAEQFGIPQEGLEFFATDPYVAGGSNSGRGASATDDNTIYTCDFRLGTVDKWTYEEGNAVDDVAVATTFELGQNYPNPFNPSTTIPFVLNKNVNVTLTVYNMLGQKVATVIDNQMTPAGMYNVQFNAENLATGMYIYRINAGNLTQTRRMMFIK